MSSDVVDFTKNFGTLPDNATDYEKVRNFHVKFGVPTDDPDSPPRLPSLDTLEYRFRFLLEELTEFRDCYEANDLEGVMDALVDLVYVAHGTALLCGVSPACWRELFDDVQRANLSKERALGSEDPRSKRGHSLDVVKPLGWVGPDGAAILKSYGAQI